MIDPNQAWRQRRRAIPRSSSSNERTLRTPRRPTSRLAEVRPARRRRRRSHQLPAPRPSRSRRERCTVALMSTSSHDAERRAFAGRGMQRCARSDGEFSFAKGTGRLTHDWRSGRAPAPTADARSPSEQKRAGDWAVLSRLSIGSGPAHRLEDFRFHEDRAIGRTGPGLSGTSALGSPASQSSRPRVSPRERHSGSAGPSSLTRVPARSPAASSRSAASSRVALGFLVRGASRFGHHERCRLTGGEPPQPAWDTSLGSAGGRADGRYPPGLLVGSVEREGPALGELGRSRLPSGQERGGVAILEVAPAGELDVDRHRRGL